MFCCNLKDSNQMYNIFFYFKPFNEIVILFLSRRNSTTIYIFKIFAKKTLFNQMSKLMYLSSRKTLYAM